MRRFRSAVAPSRDVSTLDDQVSSAGRLGIELIANPADAEVDLCLVHGLTGHRESTWTHRNGEFLPRLVASTYRKARVMTYGYDADIVRLWGPANANDLRGHGKKLAMEVANSRSASAQRPIIFLAHSLGGLVVEQALLICLEPNEPRLQDVVQNTVGILYFGTPHQGSYLASTGSKFAGLLNHVRQVNRRTLSVLKTDSEVLHILEEQFQRQLAHRFRSIKICCFYEALPIHVVGVIVSEQSAVLPAYTSCPIDADHIGMTKFAGPNDGGFLLVKGQLDDWITAAVNQGPSVSSGSNAGSRSGDSSVRPGTGTSFLGPKFNLGGTVNTKSFTVGDSTVHGDVYHYYG